MSHFYITYYNKAETSGNYPYDIGMGCLDNQEIAEAYILEYLNSIIKYENYSDLPNNQPILITDDRAMHFKYKHVFNYKEFKLFCNFYEDYDKLPSEEKLLISSGVPGEFGIKTFAYLEKLIKGEGKWAYQYFLNESFYDEDNGNEYSIKIEDGWKLQSTFWYNDELKKKYLL